MALKFTKLTRSTIRSIKPGSKITEHGITFERLTNNDGRYSVNIMVDGKRVHRVIGKESEGVTRQQVEECIAKLRTDARHSRLHLPKGRKLTLSFSKAASMYLEKLTQEGGKNIDKKEQRLRLHITPFFKDRPLAKISSFDVERYKKHRAKSAKDATINRELAVLSHLLSKSVEWNWLEFKPCKIKRLQENSGRITYLTTEQIKRVIKAASEDQSFYIYPFIVIALDTSMRRMEILSIEIKNIDIDKRVIYIPKAKAGAREQPITQNLAEFLKKYIESAEPEQKFLFPSKISASGHITDIAIVFRRVIKRAGLNPKEVIRHTLRHTAITHLVQAGVDLPTVQRISGHKTLQMVARYSHQNGTHIQAAMDKLQERYNLK